jgi:hypothetical protein
METKVSECAGVVIVVCIVLTLLLLRMITYGDGCSECYIYIRVWENSYGSSSFLAQICDCWPVILVIFATLTSWGFLYNLSHRRLFLS